MPNPSSPGRLPPALRLRRRLHNLRRRSAFEQAWLLPAWLLLGLARGAILLVPFRRLAPLLGRVQGATPWVPVLSPAQQRRALRVGRTVRLAARYTPWTSNCFPQALVASLLLRALGVP